MYLLKGEKTSRKKSMYLPSRKLVRNSSKKNVCIFQRVRKLVGKMYVPS